MERPRTFRFDKLVRDETVPGYEQDPTILDMQWHTLDTKGVRRELLAKLVEESQEVGDAGDNVHEIEAELGDVLDIVDALISQLGLDRAAIEASREEKHRKRGGFARGDYIETITVQPRSHWEAYCLRDPSKYPEVIDENS